MSHDPEFAKEMCPSLGEFASVKFRQSHCHSQSPNLWIIGIICQGWHGSRLNSEPNLQFSNPQFVLISGAACIWLRLARPHKTIQLSYNWRFWEICGGGGRNMTRTKRLDIVWARTARSPLPVIPLLHRGGSIRCSPGRLLICKTPALFHLPSASQGWKNAVTCKLQDRPSLR
jgi:hypothetical protein